MARNAEKQQNASEQLHIFIDQQLKDSTKKCKDILCQPAVFLVENAGSEVLKQYVKSL